jgi:hypothetical protein
MVCVRGMHCFCKCLSHCFILVLEDLGEIMTDHGMIKMEKGSRNFVLRSDVAHFLKMGYVIEIN